MINRRIIASGLSIVSALAVMGGATFAFFSDSATSTGNVFAAGTLSIDITDQNEVTPFEAEAIVSNWAPGDENLVNFDVLNTGTLPINVRGFATGTWGDPGLDGENRVRVIKVERWNGASWDPILDVPSGITGLFYDTNNGLVGGAPFNVAPGGRAQYQLTVEFDPNSGNNFQSKSFTSSIQVEAKQTDAPWL